jgi:flagellar hook-associated protein 1 FlgK
MANIFNIGVSALTAAQTRLATTGHNIANVNTDGYSRQTVAQETLPAQQSGVGYVGSGVQVSAVTRAYDDFLAGRVRGSSASASEADYLYTHALQVDNVISDPAAGMSQVLSDFFNSVNDVADDPTSVPTRDVMLNQADVLVSRFHSLDSYFNQLRDQSNTDLASFAGEINRLSDSIASLNVDIQNGVQGADAEQPNDLLDMRDRLIDELNQYVSTKTVTQSDGQVNVFIGNGQALVLGASANTLAVGNSPLSQDQRVLYLQTPDGNQIDVTSQISGGKMGGLLRFQQEVLNPAQDSLGLVGAGLAHYFNTEHATGMDLDGNLGGDFFTLTEPQLLGHQDNVGTATASFTDMSQVQAEEYDLRYDGASWTMIRQSDNQQVTMSGSGTAADPFVADGVSIVIGSAAAGDRYLLRPSRGGAADIETLVTDPRGIAAADPVQTSAPSSNTGSAEISAGYLSSRTVSASAAGLPVTLTYDAANQQYDISTGGSIAYDPTTDSGSSATVTITNLGDFSFTLTGTPADGDQFVLADNTGGVGDNRNALQLAALQTDKLLSNGRASIVDAYASAVADVGTSTNRAQNNNEVYKQLLDQAQAAKDSVSGVNLDEEAANLVQFQQAYQASAKVIATANTLIDTLLGIV